MRGRVGLEDGGAGAVKTESVTAASDTSTTTTLVIYYTRKVMI